VGGSAAGGVAVGGSGAVGAAGGDGGGGGVAGSGGEPDPGSDTGRLCPPGITILAAGEACNGEDDDCDGKIDEGLGTVTCGFGVCARTVQACSDGAPATCVPGTPQTTTDPCDGEDDDCDGVVDEDCAACLHVTVDGDDASAAASNGETPFASVQSALDFADSHRQVAERVCVAAGATCGSTASYPGPDAAPLVMRDGVDLLGNYESTGWTRCNDSTTVLVPNDGLGVLFASDLETPTQLDGFSITRPNAATSAGVTVDGGRNVTLSHLTIVGGTTGNSIYGVNIVNGGDATVSASTIDGGRGSFESIGVRAVGARVSVRDNCPVPLDAGSGRCVIPALTGWCPNGPAICGSSSDSNGAGEAVRLEDAAGSSVESSGLAQRNLDGDSTLAAGVHVIGDADAVVVRTSTVLVSAAQGPLGAHHPAIWVEACGGTIPRIANNASLSSTTATTAGTIREAPEGIRVDGACHAVIELNGTIATGGAALGPATAIVCRDASLCVIANNESVGTSGSSTVTGGTALGIGIDCEGQSCAKISGNGVLGRASFSRPRSFSSSSTGVLLRDSHAFLDRNTIRGGCAANDAAVGIDASGATASRIQNNYVLGLTSVCFNASPPNTFTGVGIRIRDTALLDVNSNYVNAMGPTSSSLLGSCSAVGIRSEVGGGRFRNNVLSIGPEWCTSENPLADFEESTPNADPEAFENNFLMSRTSPYFALYQDDTGALASIDAVNALTDAQVANNLGDCTPFSDGVPFALGPGSACIDAGEPSGAPLWDHDGKERDSAPDIGPTEL
jgi:hypothetical protein